MSHEVGRRKLTKIAVGTARATYLVRILWRCALVSAFMFVCTGILAGGRLNATRTISFVPESAKRGAGMMTRGSSVTRDQQHDFDFNFGTWKTHVARILHPLSGSAKWAHYDGISVVSKVWNGRASLFELEVSGPAGHIEGLGLRLYDSDSHQWSLNWAGSGGTLEQPMIGEFKDGRGEFYDQEIFNGRAIFSRNSFFDITSNSARFEQAFSGDYGKTWETNWVMTFERMKDGAETAAQVQPESSDVDQHDFDWNIGTWKTHQSRLLHPLTHSHTWVEYNGTDVVRKIWGGRANMGEVEADGPAGHLELLSLRLYNARSHQWSFIVASSAGGTLSPPSVGEFKNGRAQFVDQEPYGDKMILVRYTVSHDGANSCRFEQAFSEDGAKTWETNFIVDETRVKNDSGK